MGLALLKRLEEPASGGEKESPADPKAKDVLEWTQNMAESRVNCKDVRQPESDAIDQHSDINSQWYSALPL